MRDTRSALMISTIFAAAFGLATRVTSAQDAGDPGKAPANPESPGARDDAPGNPPEVGVLRLGAAAVSRMKKALACHERWMGREHGAISDAELPAVVARYQRDLGLTATGALDLATLDLLGVSATVAITGEASPGKAPAVIGAGASETVSGGTILLGPAELRAIEDRLMKDGVYAGPPRGAFTPELEAALRKFQSTWGIKPAQGLLDLRTLAWFPTAGIDVRVEGVASESSTTLPASARAPAAASSLASTPESGSRRIAPPAGPPSRKPALAPRAPAMRIEPIEWICPCCQEVVGETAPECGRCLMALGAPDREP